MKGVIPLFFIHNAFGPWTVALAMPAAVLGHNHSIFLKFRGGVGAGTAIGSLTGISVWIGIIVAACGLVALAISRYASVLSTTVAVGSVIILTISAILGYTPYAYILGSFLTLILMFISLRENFARLRAGTERRIGQKSNNIVKTS
jgi:glycerol-3-phosphate acyltransferase PlsY